MNEHRSAQISLYPVGAKDYSLFLVCAGIFCAVCVPFDESTVAVPKSLPEVCSHLALGNHFGNCSSACENLSSSNEDNYNTCLQSALPEKCGLVPEFHCLICAKYVWTAVNKCFTKEMSPVGIIKCAADLLLLPGGFEDCVSCLCSLICFFLASWVPLSVLH